MAKNKKKTRQRILEAASEVFAEHGFEKGTVRDICARAGANVAAVNYHFRDKHELYLQVLDAWETQGRSQFPLDGGVAPDAPVRERIEGMCGAFLKRIFFSGETPEASHRRARVFLQEIAAGTLHKDRREDSYMEIKEAMEAIVREILGQAPPVLVRDCVDSSLSQITAVFMLFVYEPEEYAQRLNVEEIERLAAHMARFALGGIQAASQEADSAQAA